MKNLFVASLCAVIISLTALPSCAGKSGQAVKYTNPIIRHNCPDPSVIDDRDRSGYFYAYSTRSGNSVLPIYKSKDMIHWEFVGDGFRGHRPEWEPDGSLWAPDINYIDGKYVLYYAMGVWGDLIKSASGVAVSDSPEGPFTDKGMIVSFANTGVKNCIDPNYFEDNGTKYLFWGSFGKGSGLWAAELSDDALSIKPGAKPVKIGAIDTEGVYVYKRKGYYYIFASRGSCCQGQSSSYHVVVARSKNILGPYTDPEGKPLTDYKYQHTILKGSADKSFVGPGHNAQIITDDAGQDWMAYHSFWVGNRYSGRTLCIDRIVWEKGWPKFMNSEPSGIKTNGPSWK